MPNPQTPISKGLGKRAYSSDSPPVSAKQLKQMSTMMEHEPTVSAQCDRCRDALGAVSLSCAACRRVFHLKCRAVDEKEPSDEPAAKWLCRLCDSAAMGMSDIEFMKYLDATPMKEEIWRTCARLVVTTRNLAMEVAWLKSQLGQLALAGATVAPEPTQVAPADNPPAKKKQDAKKTVLFIGDKLIRQLRMKVLTQLPKKASVLIKQVSSGDIESIKRETLEFLQTNQQDVHVIIHSGYNECLEFKKDLLLETVRKLVNEVRESRSNVSFSMTTVPPFTRECSEANEALARNQGSLSIEMLDLTFVHRELIHRGQYSYSSEESADACSKTIARKMASFLGTELKPLKPPRTQTPEPSPRTWAETVAPPRRPQARDARQSVRPDSRDSRANRTLSQQAQHPQHMQWAAQGGRPRRQVDASGRQTNPPGRRRSQSSLTLPSGAQLTEVIAQTLEKLLRESAPNKKTQRRSS